MDEASRTTTLHTYIHRFRRPSTLVALRVVAVFGTSVPGLLTSSSKCGPIGYISMFVSSSNYYGCCGTRPIEMSVCRRLIKKCLGRHVFLDDLESSCYRS